MHKGFVNIFVNKVGCVCNLAIGCSLNEHAMYICSRDKEGCTPNVRVLPWYLWAVQPWDSWG